MSIQSPIPPGNKARRATTTATAWWSVAGWTLALVMMLSPTIGCHKADEAQPAAPDSAAPVEPTKDTQTAATPVSANKDAFERAAEGFDQLPQVDATTVINLRKPQSTHRYYQVVAGDTLSGIARKHDCKLADIQRLNGLSTDSIRPGQLIYLPTVQ